MLEPDSLITRIKGQWSIAQQVANLPVLFAKWMSLQMSVESL
jgi:hypothetical protein